MEKGKYKRGFWSTLSFFLLLPAVAFSQGLETGQETGKADIFSKDGVQLLSQQPTTTTTPNNQVSSSSGAGPTLYGWVYYNRQENSSKYGVYSIQPEDGASLKAVWLNGKINATGGGVYVDGRYRFVSYDEATDGATYYEYDTSNWTQLKCYPLPDKTNIALDEAYDPTTGTVYGCFIDKTGSQFFFGTVDHDTHVRTAICSLATPLFAVVVSPEGQVYGISSDGNLYKVDKQTGEMTLVGATGLSPKYSQSAVCDPATGKVYWAACTQSGASGLYEVSLTTGKATHIATFASREGVVGLYIPFERATSDAPGEVTNLKATLDGAGTSGQLSFNLPTTTYGGATLSGQLDYVVRINGVEVSKGQAQAGGAVSLDWEAKEGQNDVVVVVSNAKGDGPLTKIAVWAGYDNPQPVGNLQLEKTAEGKLLLSWDAPAKGAHDGYLDASALRYTIVRYPGATTISTGYKTTSLTQSPKTTTYTNYWYTVMAQQHDMKSETATSNKVALGGAMTIPYSKEFAAGMSDWDNFTVIDANGDGTTWNSPTSSDDCATYAANDEKAADDWLVTPALQLEASRTYKVSVSAHGDGTHTESLEIKAGASNTVKTLTIAVLNKQNVTSAESQELVGYLTVPADGEYHVGIHALSEAAAATLSIESISVENGPLSAAPDSVTALKVAVAEGGALQTTVSFKTPTRQLDGTSLTSLQSVTLKRNGKTIHTFSQPALGAVLEYTDTEAANGENAYEVTATNANGEGIPAQKTVFVGVDVPTAPTDVKAALGETAIKLTWEAPKTGVNGGYVDASALTYRVLRSDGQVVATDVEGLSFEDETVSMTGRQRMVQYAVYASSSEGEGTYGMSNTVLSGSNYDLPFQETFAGGGLDNSFWGQTYKGTAYFGLSTSNSKDSNGGCAIFQPGAPDDESTLYSGKIAISQAQHPRLSFWYYAHPGKDTRIVVQVKTPDQTEHDVATIDYSALIGDKGWRRGFILLGDYAKENYVQVQFRAVSGDGETPVIIDDILLSECQDNDLSVTLPSVKTMTKGSATNIVVTVTNEGLQTVSGSDYRLTLCDSQGVIYYDGDGETLASGESHAISIPMTLSVFAADKVELTASVDYASDENPDDNTSDVCAVTAKSPVLPGVESLKGTINNTAVKLDWKQSVATQDQFSVTDDVEGYEAFAIDQIGEWTMYDGDQQQTYGIGDGQGSYRKYANALDPKAFIVFNAPQSGVTVYDSQGNPTNWTPYSGDQMFVSFQASGTGVTDDWMISPELPGFAQTISFMVKSVNTESHGKETFEVLYSTTDNNPNSFKKIDGIIEEAPGEWTKVEAALPEGAHYFAIRGTSVGHFALFVDDISYAVVDASQLVLKGYNVYCNKKKLNDEPVATPQYAAETGAGFYQVSAVWEQGESLPCEAIALGDVSGIDSVNADAAKQQTYYNLSGQRVSRPQRGIYINGNGRKKVRK